MERELWKRVYQVVGSLSRSRRRRRARFPDRLIALVMLWAALHDRTIKWACDGRNWSPLRPRRLPSESTMSRRLRTASVRVLLDAVEARLRTNPVEGFAPGGMVKIADGKPLPVGGHSKDPDARNGRGAGGMARHFARLTNLAGGLGPLPNWVRRLDRVKRWVQSKLILHALRTLPQPTG